MSGRLSVALTLLTLVGLTVPALAADPPKGMVPLKLTANSKVHRASQFAIPLDPPVSFDKMTGDGDGAPLGPFTVIEQIKNQLDQEGNFHWWEAVGAFTGANGDAIFFTYRGLLNGTKTAFLITGGRGRFKGATGGGVMTWAEGATTSDFVEFTCIFDGLISEPLKLQ